MMPAHLAIQFDLPTYVSASTGHVPTICSPD